MTSESKILTVSYGTFSCTLEGFDDPFDTMKAIAEYFRDLSAQDRHFGAEPPQPDAAMLHRIAEREVSRLVGSGAPGDVALAPSPSEAPPSDTAPGLRVRMNPAGHPRVMPRSVDRDAPAEDETTAAEPSLQDIIPDGVAAKLARIRRAVNHSPSAPLSRRPLDVVTSGPVVAPTVAAASPFAAFAEDDLTLETDIEEPALPSASDEMVSILDALMAEPVESAPPVIEEVDEIEEIDEAPAAEPEVQLADSWYESGETALEEVDDLIGDAAEAESDPLLADDIDQGLPADIAAFEDETDTQPDDHEAALPEDLDAAQPEDYAAAAEAPLAETAAAMTDEPEAVLPEDLAAAQPEDFAEATEEPLAETVTAMPEPELPSAEPETAVTAKNGNRSKRANSRIIRLHPEDEEAATGNQKDRNVTRILGDDEGLDEVSRLMRQTDDAMSDAENRRRLEALAHLKAAVVATEADRAAGDYEAPSPDSDRDPYRDDLAEAIIPSEPVAEAEPAEVRPRRKSVSVRPQEPRPGTIRPGMISPPPLVLVSEQRIDRFVPAQQPAAEAPLRAPERPEGQPMVALRTGRLTGAIGIGSAGASTSMAQPKLVLEKSGYGQVAELEDDDDLNEDIKEADELGLARFADKVGVNSVAEMLEAAAAYAICVENRSQFTRPQLMRRMMACAADRQVSREDGLRNFGTLLRTGRIEKIGRGHYVLAENSPYLAEARRFS